MLLMIRSKYGVAKKSDRTYNGVVYMSKLEMDYRKYLELLQKASDPHERPIKIEEQVPFKIEINGHKICTYLLDFRVNYFDRTEYVDTKGVITAIYRLKKKLVEAVYKIKIKEVKRGDFKR